MEPQTTPQAPRKWQQSFFTIWSGQAVSLLGSSLVQFALVWWITKTTGSATVLAMATLVAMLPQIIIGPFAGALVDRWNRRMVMMVADSAIALVSLWLAVMFLIGKAQVWQVFVVMAIRSIGGSFHWPAMQASTTLMVPGEHLSRIAGLNQALFGVTNIVSPPLGALLLEILPTGGVLLIDVFTAAVAVSTIAFVIIPQPPRAVQVDAKGRRTSVWQEMGVGFRYVAGWPGLLALGGIAMLINFLVNPAFSLLPILVTKHFQGQAIQLGAINSAWGIGVIVGGLILSAWGGFRKKIYTAMTGLAGMGVGILIIGISPASLFILAVIGMGLAGLLNPIANGPLFAIFQTTIAPEMQGRVLSLISSVAALISPLSLMIAGPVADALGVQVWYIVAGIACIVMALVSLFIPTILQIEEQAKALAQ